MSIFEPIPRESRSDQETQEFEDGPSEGGADPSRGSFDPRSIAIAGVVVVGIVAAGLLVSNAARPEPQPRPVVASRVDPGAAAVEQVEVKPTGSAAGPSASASVEPVDNATGSDSWAGSDSDEPSGWQEPEDSSDDYASSGGAKWDDKPGRGHGRRNR